MSVAALNIDPVDANWRILQDCSEKKVTARARSREATQARRRRGSKSYHCEKPEGWTPNPHQHLAVVSSGIQLPAVDAPDLDEPVSIALDDITPVSRSDADDGIDPEILEIFDEEQSAAGIAVELDGYYATSAKPRHVIRRLLMWPSDDCFSFAEL